MHRLWWQLPGPSKFISGIVQNIRDGKNIAVLLPDHSPHGIKTTIRYALEENDFPWYSLDVSQETTSDNPIHILYSRFVPLADPIELRNVRSLISKESFSGHVIWVEGFDLDNWKYWKQFIEDYEHYCRSVSVFNRTVFCILLKGDLSLDPPKEDVCLSHSYLQGHADTLDMLLFTSILFQEKSLPKLQKQVAISTVANLSLWDPMTADRLAREKIKNILNPISILKVLAQERNWEIAYSNQKGFSWHKGMENKIDGENKIHSAALAISGRDTEIYHRIWSAEVGILFPFVEKRRHEILNQLNEVLKVPFKTRFGDVIEDLQDLEIGHIESQILTNNIEINPQLWNCIQLLRRIRNSLAHSEPVPLEVLCSEELGHW